MRDLKRSAVNASRRKIRTFLLPRQSSLREKQRFPIARALANNPAMLLINEPICNLDSKNGREIVVLLGKLIMRSNNCHGNL